jgi:endonuclease/exonuclease/phosphatase family metal-dependent hydrolase
MQSVIAMLRTTRADVIVLQEVDAKDYELLRSQMTGYTLRENGQFWLASRFPVQEVYAPPRLAHEGAMRSPRFVRYTLTTPRGPLLVYNIHPISPRDGFEALRGQGLLHEVRKGRLFNAAARASVASNTLLRMTELRAMVGDAGRSPYPAVFAGDTNLPGLSWAFADQFSNYRDGFSEAGTGFGYTFPAPLHPWTRIDRIIADPQLQFLDFTVVHEAVSDHLAVLADLQWKTEAVGLASGG